MARELKLRYHTSVVGVLLLVLGLSSCGTFEWSLEPPVTPGSSTLTASATPTSGYDPTTAKEQPVEAESITAAPSTKPPVSSATGDPGASSDLDWCEYVSERVTRFSNPFRLYYPCSWRLVIEQTVVSDDDKSANYWLYSEGHVHSLRIYQSPAEGASCLYPEDPQLEGMYSRFGPYVEIRKSSDTGGVEWRVATGEGQVDFPAQHTVCERRREVGPPGDFVTNTSIGLFYFVEAREDPIALNEFLQMVNRIEILP